jgi:mannose-6-phosphate isomerase-like protein (cupin superfamily)
MNDIRTAGSSDGGRSRKANGPDLSRQHVARVIRYEMPESKRDRHIVSFGRTDSMMVFMQVLLRSGESSLHKHPNTDSFWWVVRGKAAFYTTDHELLAELEPEHGVLLPRDYPYYFSAVGKDHLEILQIESFLRQGERLQTVYLEEDRVGDYEITESGEYASARPTLAAPWAEA